MVGQVEDYVPRSKKPARDEDELTAFDRDLIGRAVRIEIPFSGRYQMRQIADILRGYAEKIDFTARRRDLETRSMLVMLKMEARIVNRRIRDLTEQAGPGKTPQRYQREQ